jgi:hypothetical protein
MSRRFLAVALALVMIAAVVVVLAPAAGLSPTSHASGAASPTVAAQPNLGISYELYDGLGEYAYNTYYIGIATADTLTFYVHDPLDQDVNVTITDPNATRDGVASPAFTYEAKLNTTTDAFTSYKVGVQYTFPTLAYGGTWVVNFSAPVAGYVTQNVTLLSYSVTTATSVASGGSTLPGMPVSVFWWATLDANGNSPYTGATSVWLWGTYTGNGTSQNLFAGGKTQLTTGSWGQWNGTVPLNTTANTDLDFTVSVVTTVGGVIAENESAPATIQVGHLEKRDRGITNEPAYCLGSDISQIPQNSTAAACVEFGVQFEDGTFYPVAGLPVTIAFWNGTAHVPLTGEPTSATTDVNGEVEVTFLATAPPFTNYFQYPYYSDAVNFTATVPGANSTGDVWTIWQNVTDWGITPASGASGVVNAQFGNTEYFAGTTATVAWSISTAGEGATGPITANGWILEDVESEGTVYATGTIGGAAQSGTVSVAITSAMVGTEVRFVLLASNATLPFDAYAYATVIAPTLLLTPDSIYYTAGSSVTTTASLAGTAAAPAGTTITWQEWAEWSQEGAYVLVTSGTVANGGTFNFPIPSTTPPQYVEIDAWASAGGLVLTSNSAYLGLEQGYSVLLGVGTVSNYADGSYQPGQTVTLNYQVVAIDGAPLPQVFSFDLFAAGYPFEQVINNVAPTGSVSFTIPSNAPAGGLTVLLSVSGDLSAGCVSSVEFDENDCTGVTTLNINPHPSVLSMDLGAGSGLTVGWLILLILVILVAIVLYVVLRRRGGSRMSGGGTNTTTPMSPPAPPPSTGPATEWQQPGSSGSGAPPASGDAQPPLPPPAGSS